MIYPSKAKGFTLIELLVVMAISMVGLGLVGGLMVDGYTKFQVKSEIKRLETLIVKANMQSFLKEKKLSMHVQGGALAFYLDHKNVLSESFDFLTFSKTTVSFNKLGLPDQNYLVVEVAGKTKELNLNASHESLTSH